MKTTQRVEISGQDLLELQKNEQGFYQIKAKGCKALIEAAKNFNDLSIKDLSSFALPEGSDHVSILFRELILKATGEWNYPYQEDELCHCRAIPTEIVDRAIINGLATPEEVGRFCAAGITCGNCRTDVENILQYRRRKN